MHVTYLLTEDQLIVYIGYLLVLINNSKVKVVYLFLFYFSFYAT